MTMGPTGNGGRAVAQPAGGAASPPLAARLELACFGCFALVTLGLALWATATVRNACGGPAAPLDDSYIHFQFARSFARFHPFEYAADLPRVPGATSLLWPALLTPALWLGASGSGLICLTWLLGFASLFGQACEVLLASKRFLSLPFAFLAGLLVLTLSANTWFAASAMEVVPLGFVLLRSARRAAEYWEGARTPWRERELLLLAFAAVTLRPEGALGALCAAGVLGFGGRKWGQALLALGALLLVPLVNLAFTGQATQTTLAAKWLPVNPYYQGRLVAVLWGNVQLFFGTLLDGREWSWTFIPEGYRLVGAACLPALALAAERRGARVHAALLCLVGLGALIPASYETFLVNRLRYLWPFSAPWLLGLAALGQLAGDAVARAVPQFRLAGLLLPAAAGVGFVRLAPISLNDLAVSAAAITAQQVSLGHWAEQALPTDARIGVNDAGAIAFYSGRKTFDVVGLTTRGEARYWVGGAGSRFEHYERLSRAELPTHFVVYPEWFGIQPLLGHCLTERRVEGATILGGPLMVACAADYSSLHTGDRPTLSVGTRSLLDELDVADLDSEALHGYQLHGASAQDNGIFWQDNVLDGGRARRTLEDFVLDVVGDGLLVLRFASDAPAALVLTVAGKPARELGTHPARERGASAGQLQELSFPVPPGTPRGVAAISLRSPVPLTLFHYWSYGPH